jgi:glycosyltransferase involved in cell wall biosynthesis
MLRVSQAFPMRSSPTRIMHISSEYPPYMISGLGTHVHQLVQSLGSDKYEVFVFSYNPDLTSIICDRNITVHLISPLGKINDLRKTLDIGEINKLNDQIVRCSVDFFSQRSPPELIHCHDWLAFSAAKTLRRVFRAPVVTTVHFLEEWTAGWGEKYPGRDFVGVQSKMFRMSDAVITVSQFMKTELERIDGVDPRRVHVVYNGVDTKRITASGADVTEIETARREFAPNGEKIVLFAGRIDYLKGVSALIISAARVLERLGDTIYLIAGECLPGEYTDFVFGLANNLHGLNGRIRFLGKLPKRRLFQLYYAADVVVVPSVYESFGYVAAEAMAAGAPVIASNTGGLPELIEHGENGVLIPLNKDTMGNYSVDVMKLADAQIELLRDKALRSRMGLAGKQLVTSRFTLRNMLGATIDVYNNLPAPENLEI